MRLSSEFWVSALMRQVRDKGGFAYLTRRGALEAGAIFIVLHRCGGVVDLYAPAPQSVYDSTNCHDERIFVALFEQRAEEEAVAKLEREIRFDSDIWLVEVEGWTTAELPFVITT